MTLSYRCSNCGTELMTTNADPLDAYIEQLRAALRTVRAYIKDCDHQPALDEIDAALRLYKS